jgi:hypothetical protein
MIAAFLFLLPAGALASSLVDFIEHHPRSAPLIRDAYRDALRDFGNDPVFCRENAESAGSCARMIREQTTLLRSPRFGEPWIREQEPRPSPYGPVLAFRNPNLSENDGTRVCEGVLSIPAGSKHHKHLSFDLFCEEKTR